MPKQITKKFNFKKGDKTDRLDNFLDKELIKVKWIGSGVGTKLGIKQDCSLEIKITHK